MDTTSVEQVGRWALAGSGPGLGYGVALLVAARVFGLVWMVPGWSGVGLSARMRVCLAGFVAILVLPGVLGVSAPQRLPALADGMGWAVVLAAEALVGAVLGISAALVVAGARQAGEILGLQAGLAPGSLLEVEATGGLVGDGEGVGMTPFGVLYGWVALLVFLAVDGPLLVVDALVRSFRVIPAGLGWGRETPLLSRQLVGEVFARTGSALGLALQAAAPVGLALLLAGMVLAVVSRTATRSPMSGVAWPLRAAVGIGLTAILAGVLVATVGSAWRAWSLGL
jgi:flagellar biosynthetic protein FliR